MGMSRRAWLGWLEGLPGYSMVLARVRTVGVVQLGQELPEVLVCCRRRLRSDWEG